MANTINLLGPNDYLEATRLVKTSHQEGQSQREPAMNSKTVKDIATLYATHCQAGTSVIQQRDYRPGLVQLLKNQNGTEEMVGQGEHTEL